jgi:hypothetical protein
MTAINTLMQQALLRDFTDYLDVVKRISLHQEDICEGLVKCVNLLEDIQDDFKILDESVYKKFIEARNQISLENMRAKEERRRGFADPKDPIDVRNQKITILWDHDFLKHKKILGLVKKLVTEAGWFSQEGK